MGSIRIFGLTCAVLIGVATSASAANLVTNGDFETGDLTGWTNGGWTAGNGPLGTVMANDGTFAAFNGCTDFCDLSQTLTTQPGQFYFLSFDFNPGMSADLDGAEMQVFWDGSQVFDQVGYDPSDQSADWQ